MGSFALGLWGDVVGYPASSLGSFTSKLADFHKFVKEILSPHLSLEGHIKLYITATLVQSLSCYPETISPSKKGKCV